MKKISRRRFVATAALSAAAAQMRMYGQSAARVTLSIPREATGARMPDDFIGLSYEVGQLAHADFFSPKNTGLIGAFKEISAHGVLRLGGFTSEFAMWKATADAPDPELPKIREVQSLPKSQFHALTPQAVGNLAGFLEATGWTCIYGIGLAANTPERAAEEADFVARTLGPRLNYFQIGNEVDGYGGTHLRNAQTWNENAYLDEWLVLARAIEARVPGARFGLPDAASSIDWLTGIAKRWPTIKNPPRVVALTHHYYSEGPATNPNVTIPNLLKPAAMERVQSDATATTTSAWKMGAQARLTEGNTCFGGGKPGVSDVFASALWAADFSLLLASSYYSGVNLHGGPVSYTPIATVGSEYVMEPVSYGLKFAGMLSGGRFYQSNFVARLQAGGVNATAYAVKLADGRTSVVILNKDGGQDLDLTVEFGPGAGSQAETEILHAPALDSREAQITRLGQGGRLENGRLRVSIPHATGMRVTIS